MKKSFKIFAVLLVASLVLPFAGCGNSSETSEESSSELSQTDTTADSETTTASSTKISEVLTSLHSIDTENGNEFAGTWKIVDGVGSKLDSFIFEFNGDKEACLIIDNVGYVGTYSLEETDGKRPLKHSCCLDSTVYIPMTFRQTALRLLLRTQITIQPQKCRKSKTYPVFPSPKPIRQQTKNFWVPGSQARVIRFILTSVELCIPTVTAYSSHSATIPQRIQLLLQLIK